MRVLAHVDFIRGLDVVEQPAEGVGRSEHHVDVFRVRDQLVIPHLAEHVFQAVGELVDGRQAEKAGRALDRMDRAKDGVDQVDVDVLSARLDLQQLALDVAQVLARFGDKLSHQFRIVECHREVPRVPERRGAAGLVERWREDTRGNGASSRRDGGALQTLLGRLLGGPRKTERWARMNRTPCACPNQPDSCPRRSIMERDRRDVKI